MINNKHIKPNPHIYYLFNTCYTDRSSFYFIIYLKTFFTSFRAILFIYSNFICIFYLLDQEGVYEATI